MNTVIKIGRELHKVSEFTAYGKSTQNGIPTPDNPVEIVNSYDLDRDIKNVNIPYVLRGVPVTDGGNYIDSKGQMWVSDTLTINADGTGEYVQRVTMVERAIKDMNNTENYAGWLDVPELYLIVGYNYNLPITESINNVGSIPKANTNVSTALVNRTLFVNANDFGVSTQTELKQKYPDLVYRFYAGLLTPVITQLTKSQVKDIFNNYLPRHLLNRRSVIFE